MAISCDYPTPVTVNGYACRNCSEVSRAQRHIDPAHPKSGPFGATAASDPTATAEARKKVLNGAPATSLAERPPAYGAGGKLGGGRAVGSLVDVSG